MYRTIANKTMREQLIEALKNLLDDDDAIKVEELDVPQLVDKLINVANFYADSYYDLTN
jgi:vacuolar-type H+-ATPase subunit E/Vma4